MFSTTRSISYFFILFYFLKNLENLLILMIKRYEYAYKTLI
jgi:hypothetical protein